LLFQKKIKNNLKNAHISTILIEIKTYQIAESKIINSLERNRKKGNTTQHKSVFQHGCKTKTNEQKLN
jgi:hypothetical protein